jgi:hypothetical protein
MAYFAQKFNDKIYCLIYFVDLLFGFDLWFIHIIIVQADYYFFRRIYNNQ